MRNYLSCPQLLEDITQKILTGSDLLGRSLHRLGRLQELATVWGYHENTPLKTKQDNRGGSWWNNKLDKMRKEVRRLFNRAKDSGNWDQYRSAFTDYNREIRRAKRESWRRFCKRINDVPRSTRIHKILFRTPVEEWGSIKLLDGSYTDSGMDTLQLLALNHFPRSLSLNDEHTWARGQTTKRLQKND
ncbi:hypothetical protein NQ315_005081 [Exocentrus adspersus]|uniref:Uncharacterized protein n=1 Tax=Exocentrus adspersus TaxID=1586481 RepID=A0AAV8V7G2_9CUCU|nr:hypothetical protein NQ315_005081 [Exocentrus adspersus]